MSHAAATSKQVTASQGQRLLASRAEIINELEALRPLAMMLHPHNASTWHPAYIYVLRCGLAIVVVIVFVIVV